MLAIRYDALYHPKLNIKAVRLFAILGTLVRCPKESCNPSNDYLSYKSAQTERSVERNLKLLDDFGFIKRESKPNRKIWILPSQNKGVL